MPNALCQDRANHRGLAMQCSARRTFWGTCRASLDFCQPLLHRYSVNFLASNLSSAWRLRMNSSPSYECQHASSTKDMAALDFVQTQATRFAWHASCRSAGEAVRARPAQILQLLRPPLVIRAARLVQALYIDTEVGALVPSASRCLNEGCLVAGHFPTGKTGRHSQTLRSERRGDPTTLCFVWV